MGKCARTLALRLHAAAVTHDMNTAMGKQGGQRSTSFTLVLYIGHAHNILKQYNTTVLPTIVLYTSLCKILYLNIHILVRCFIII